MVIVGNVVMTFDLHSSIVIQPIAALRQWNKLRAALAHGDPVPCFDAHIGEVVVNDAVILVNTRLCVSAGVGLMMRLIPFNLQEAATARPVSNALIKIYFIEP